MSKVSVLLLALSVVLLGFEMAPLRAADDSGAWSKPVNGLQGRLSVTRTEALNGTPTLTTYLELRNVSTGGNVMELPLGGEDATFQFTVTDSHGKSVSPAGGPYDEIRAKLGLMRLPFDSLLRLNIAHRGAGVPRDQAAHLDLGALSTWDFKRGDKETYHLQGKLTVKSRDDRHWSGTLTLPRVKLPTGGE